MKLHLTEDITENETSTEANTTLVSSDLESADTEADSGEDESSEEDDGGADRVNEIYTVNGKAFDYMMNPIVL